MKKKQIYIYCLVVTVISFEFHFRQSNGSLQLLSSLKKVKSDNYCDCLIRVPEW